MPDLYELQRQARSYPGYLLKRGGTALSLFAAGYWGWNDCIHFLRHNMACDCVDINAKKLEEMRGLYPETWTFTTADAWSFAKEAAIQGRTWDVVSIDTFLGDATQRSIDSLAMWSMLADQMVTVTVPLKADIKPPPGWTSFMFPRSPRAAWMVLQR